MKKMNRLSWIAQGFPTSGSRLFLRCGDLHTLGFYDTSVLFHLSDKSWFLFL